MKIHSTLKALALVATVAGLAVAADQPANTNQQAAPAVAPGQSSDPTMPSYQAATSDQGTVSSIKKQGEEYNIKLNGDMGNQKEFKVSKDIDVRDAENKKVSISQVKKGSQVTLNLEGGKVTQIFINS